MSASAPQLKQPSLWPLFETIVAMSFTFVLSVLVALAAQRPSVVLPGDEVTIWGFLLAFASATALMLIITRRFKQTRLLEAVFLLAVFTGIAFALLSLFGVGAAILGTSICVFLYYRSRSVLVFDLLLIVGCAGVAANLGGSMRPTGIAVILAMLAVYDIVAVYVTKHMVEMAEAMLRRKAFFAMILTERFPDMLLPVSAVAPGSGFTFLGAGDVILPALLVSSVALVDVRAAALVAVGSLFGCVVLHLVFIAQHERRPMPALPPIAVGALLGFVASFFLTSPL